MKNLVAKKTKKRLVTLLVIVLIVVSLVSYNSMVLQPLIIKIAEEETRLLLAQKLNDKNLKIQEYVEKYDNLYDYKRNDKGEIVLISANTSAINVLCMMSQYEIQSILNTFADEKIHISVGALIGGSLFADLGDKIAITVYSLGTSTVEWKSQFTSCGINQTLHRSFIVIKSSVSIILPTQSKNITMTTELLVAENVLVGTVPDTYLTGIDDSSILDLVP